ncbi:MAG: hypothetical protein GXY20_10860 [Clostridiales bacterium]|nr:hypothetical protein [Clostridiales bacterium]
MDTIGCEDFYKDAMEFFIEAGHATSSVPVYFNHSVKQVIYFDTNKTLLIDNAQRRDLEYAVNISHLFDIGDDVFASQIGEKVSYYSIVIECGKKSRSQIAYETHILLHPVFEADMSIVLFMHNDTVMVSIFGSGSDLILSDWYSVDTDYDSFIERLHIANLSLSSARKFVSDLSYCIARDYYFRSAADSNSMYSLLPVKFFGGTDILDITKIDKETIKETIREISSAPEKAYGDDYIEPASSSVEAIGDIDVELDLLSFELESEEETIPDEILNDDEVGREDDFDEIEGEEETAKDKYEFDDVDPEVFKDANQLVKWLKKKESTI